MRKTRVLIVGSMHCEELQNSEKDSPERLREKALLRKRFRNACKALGWALAEAECDILIGSESPRTADRYIAVGAYQQYQQRQKNGKPLTLHVFHPEAESEPYVAEEEEWKNVHFVKRRLRGTWDSARVPQLQAADVLIVIGGGESTLSVAYAAPLLERPVFPVGAFGGAANKIWKFLGREYKKLGEFGKELEIYRQRWSDNIVDEQSTAPSATEGDDAKAETTFEVKNEVVIQPDEAAIAEAQKVVKHLKRLLKYRVFKVDKRTPLLWMFGIEVALLLVWIFFFTGVFIGGDLPETMRLFLMMPVAAFLGTGLRNAIRLNYEPTVDIMLWQRIITELSLGMLIGFALSLIYLAGGIVLVGDQNIIPNQPGATGLFQRISITMSLLGFVGGFMIERAEETLRKWFSESLLGKSVKTK